MATVDLPDVLTVEDVETDLKDGDLNNPWQAVLYNCDCHTYAQVIEQLMLALGCSRDQAYELAWSVAHHGRASVYFGAKAECERVIRILRDIGLRAEAEHT